MCDESAIIKELHGKAIYFLDVFSRVAKIGQTS